MSFVSSIEEHTNMLVSICGDAVNSPSVRFLSYGAALSFRAMRGSGSLHTDTDTLVRSRKILLRDVFLQMFRLNYRNSYFIFKVVSVECSCQQHAETKAP